MANGIVEGKLTSEICEMENVWARWGTHSFDDSNQGTHHIGNPSDYF